ncbi:MAG: SDR family oxidoreductase [Pyrinomonadaceae bacterium MAG19_C2-C3]|nr:SDR family oxidoreductase [Pyrinomonadaceae bacterium MAG19_C2-C3]
MNNDKNEHPFPPKLMRGQTAIITGASRGIGRATALRFAQAGANVCINYLKDEGAAEEVARLCRTHDVEAVTVCADVARLEDAEMMIETCVRHFNRVDALVANAGIWEGAAVDAMSEDLWERVINANLKGTWTVCRAVVPVMRKHGRGSIVIVSSTAGQRGEAGYSNYAASKGGQISFTKSLAVELAPHIRVNSVAPGWVDTGMNDDVFTADEYKQKIIEAIPLQRMASADDIAASILFLASDWARHITGEILNVNGGAVLCG